MFPPELFDYIANEPNKYADKLQQQKGQVIGSWRRTTAHKMRAYVAAHIVMGICDLQTNMYFSTDIFKSTGISERFTWDTQDKLHQYYVDDNSHNPPMRESGHDKLGHVWHVMTVSIAAAKMHPIHTERYLLMRQ